MYVCKNDAHYIKLGSTVVYICKHIHIYIHIRIRMHTYIYKYIYTYIYIYTHICTLYMIQSVQLYYKVCVKMRVFVYVCMYLCTELLSNPHLEVCIGMGWQWLVGFLKYRSLLQNIVSFIGLFCQRDLCF